jgi:hypothetical protein
MNIWLIIALVISQCVTAAIFFIIGRDSGETSNFKKISAANEKLLKQNLDLKWENNRLNRAMGYYDDGVLSDILKKMDEGQMSGYEPYPDWE